MCILSSKENCVAAIVRSNYYIRKRMKNQVEVVTVSKSDKEKIRDALVEGCFGNVPGHVHCCVLVEDVCLYGACPFYKTRAQFEADRKKSENRMSVLSALPERKSGRMIRCIETGRVYYSIRQAADSFKVAESAIRQVLSGRRPHCCGNRFEYV